MNRLLYFACFVFMAGLCCSGFALHADSVATDSAAPVKVRIGFEKEIEVRPPVGTVLRKRVLSGNPPVWIRLWAKENKAYGVAFTALENGDYDLKDFCACFDARGCEVPFSVSICAEGRLTAKDDGHVAPVHPIAVLPHAYWTPLRILYAVFALWSALFLGFIFLKLYRFFKHRLHRTVTVDLPPVSLYERIETLLDRSVPALSLREQDELYVLVLSAWAARECWGQHVLIASLYPHIHAQNHYETLHRTLENWLYAQGPAPDFAALKNSCRPLDAEGGRP